MSTDSTTSMDLLAHRMADDRVLPVIGSGVSFAAAKLPTWADALTRVLDFLTNAGVALPDLGTIQDHLIAHRYMDAAEGLQSALHGVNGWPVFLHQTFHQDRNPDGGGPLLNAISNLQAPFSLTTNYDRLLELYGMPGISSTTWDERNRLMIALNEGGTVVHLHGIYDRPNSVVLSISDYKRIGMNEAYTAFMRSVWMQYTLLFIGCSSDGLGDSDFTGLFDWAEKTFPDTPYLHYILAKTGTVAPDVRLQLLTKSRVQVIEYGDSFDELPGWLEELSTRADAHRKARELARSKRATAAPVTPTSASVTPPPPVRLRELSIEEKDRLVEAFARTETMAVPSRRQTLIQQLPRDVRYNIPRSNVMIQEVTAIVTTSLGYPSALKALLDRIRYFEGPTFARQDLDAEIATLFPGVDL